ncbi:hypothetical protein [Endozoicomonas sp. SESOKO1]|uniref:hypothetical protein n=1 Tax=Endozoicomonas sp. SESOKO1 TaxID=2828742 RepID=UPI0021491752|nr:hypothetical protein [Endozoicomonas sp. SESOKO1]
MKTTQYPLTLLDKPNQRRRLNRDVRHYQHNGGRITRLGTGTARGLCPVNLNDVEQLCGHYREL